MFDPTIFDNLKIVLEGAVYDRDLDMRWAVLHREDLVDLASMGRTFIISFSQKDKPVVVATVELSSDIRDFSGEWLSDSERKPGCIFLVKFVTSIDNLDQCESIKLNLLDIWGGRPLIQQHLTFTWPQKAEHWQVEIVLHFERKFDETNIMDIENVLDHISLSLDYLNGLHRG